MIANMQLGELVMLLYHLRRGHSVKFNPTLIVYRYKPTKACIISYCQSLNIYTILVMYVPLVLLIAQVYSLYNPLQSIDVINDSQVCNINPVLLSKVISIVVSIVCLLQPITTHHYPLSIVTQLHGMLPITCTEAFLGPASLSFAQPRYRSPGPRGGSGHLWCKLGALRCRHEEWGRSKQQIIPSGYD